MKHVILAMALAFSASGTQAATVTMSVQDRVSLRTADETPGAPRRENGLFVREEVDLTLPTFDVHLGLLNYVELRITHRYSLNGFVRDHDETAYLPSAHGLGFSQASGALNFVQDDPSGFGSAQVLTSERLSGTLRCDGFAYAARCSNYQGERGDELVETLHFDGAAWNGLIAGTGDRLYFEVKNWADLERGILVSAGVNINYTVEATFNYRAPAVPPPAPLSPVPLPAGAVLLLSGLAGMGAARYVRRRQT